VVDPLRSASDAAMSALVAQSMRMRIVSENIANSQSTGAAPGQDPYRRKTISFAEELDQQTGASRVSINTVARDPAAFPVETRPGHPAADNAGRVKMPNVNMIIEMADMRQATRSYEANLQVVRQVREMRSGLVDLLRSS
jgi:flagellar basal-body rod protein FlgC